MENSVRWNATTAEWTGQPKVPENRHECRCRLHGWPWARKVCGARTYHGNYYCEGCRNKGHNHK